jgi:hypothetical protein
VRAAGSKPDVSFRIAEEAKKEERYPAARSGSVAS